MNPDSERNGRSSVNDIDRFASRVRERIGQTRFAEVVWVAETGSTNDDLAVLAGADRVERVRFAEVQTAGRGRRNRDWCARSGSSLLVSFLVRDGRDAAPFWTIGSVALAAAEVGGEHGGVEVTLKWPNDLLIGDHKVAGILAVGVGGATIVGLGLNVDWSDGRPRGVPEHATALDRHGRAGQIDRVALAGDLVAAVDRWLAVSAAEVRTAWSARCSTLGRRVRAELDGTDVVGTALAVDHDGALCLETATSRVVVHVGDVVHLRPIDSSE